METYVRNITVYTGKGEGVVLGVTPEGGTIVTLRLTSDDARKTAIRLIEAAKAAEDVKAAED